MSTRSTTRSRRLRNAKREVKVVAVYCRISRDMHGDALGVERQEAACRSLVLARWGEGIVVLLYVDNDVSAYDRSIVRPEFERMLRDSELKMFDVIVAWDLDRIGRRLTDLERCVRMADETGVPMVTVNGDFDLTSASGKAYARIVMAIAEMESDHKSERLVEKFEYDRMAGKPMWRRRPFGYLMDGTIVEAEAVILRDAAERLLGGETLSSIVMSMQHVATPWGRPFTIASLKVNLLSPRYISKSTGRDGEIYGDGNWDPIFDVPTHYRLTRRFPVDSTHNTAPYLCSGLIYCEGCGLKLHGRNDKARDRADYKCSKQPSLHRFGCSMSATSSAVERVVVDELIHNLATPENRQQIMLEGNVDPDGIAAVIEDLLYRKQALVNMVADGTIDQGEARPKIETINQKLNANRDKLVPRQTADALKDLPYGEDNLRSVWEDMTMDERRIVLRAAVDRIYVRRASRRGGPFDADRVRIIWPGEVVAAA